MYGNSIKNGDEIYGIGEQPIDWHDQLWIQATAGVEDKGAAE